MLLVRTYLDRSSIHGLGLYAGEDIRAGTLILELMDGFDFVVDPATLEKMPPVAREWIDRYGYLCEPRNGYVICADDARFFNHSADPNTKSTSYLHTVALRDIEMGEELTCNYFEFDQTAENHFKDGCHTAVNSKAEMLPETA